MSRLLSSLFPRAQQVLNFLLSRVPSLTDRCCIAIHHTCDVYWEYNCQFVILFCALLSLLAVLCFDVFALTINSTKIK